MQRENGLLRQDKKGDNLRSYIIFQSKCKPFILTHKNKMDPKNNIKIILE